MENKENRIPVVRESLSGRTYVSGRRIDKDLLDLVLRDLIEAKAEMSEQTGLPKENKYGLSRGTLTKVATKYRLSRHAVTKHWISYMRTGRPIGSDSVIRARRGQKKLSGDNLEYVRFVKLGKPSMLQRQIKDQLINAIYQHSKHFLLLNIKVNKY